MLYWRGQPKGIGKDPKQRTVWGYSHVMTVLELMIQMALLDALKGRPEFCAWVNADRVADVLTALLHNANQEVLSVDFSGFDASVPSEFIHAAFDLIRLSFQPSAGKLIDLIEDCFLHCKLITPEGILTGRDGAVPSGSGLTNLVDSLVQMLIAHYVAWLTRNEISAITQGDDGIWNFRRPWDLDEVAAIVDEIGMTISSDKGGVSKEVLYFLQNVHSADYTVNGIVVGVRPIMRVLNGMMSYERLTKAWTSYDDTVRWWQQAESAKYHPKFLELAKFLYDHDLYSRTLSATQVVHRGGGIAKIARDLKQDSFPYGKAPLNGLRDFRIVKELSRLRSEMGQLTRSVA